MGTGCWVLCAGCWVLTVFPAAGAKGNSRFTLAVDLWRESGALPRPDLGCQPVQSLNPSGTEPPPKDSREYRSQSATFPELCSPPPEPSICSLPGAVVPVPIAMLGVQYSTM